MGYTQNLERVIVSGARSGSLRWVAALEKTLNLAVLSVAATVTDGFKK
jgi:hypothetical protein